MSKQKFILDKNIRDRYIADKNVRITLVDPNTWENYDLYYTLYYTELAKKWLKVMEDMRFGEKSIREKSIKFTKSQNYTDDASLKERINKVLQKINRFYDKQIRLAKDLDQETLNYLHEEYEIYGQRLSDRLSQKHWDTAYKNIDPKSPEAVRWPGITFDEEFHSAFTQLNDAIHTAEMYNSEAPLIISPDTPLNSFANLLISFNPRLDFELTELDKASFLHKCNFGDLVLGYNTLGKSITHIVDDLDQRAVDEDAIVPQTTWSNEIAAFLTNDIYNPLSLTNEYKKFKKLGLDKKGFTWADVKDSYGYLGIGIMMGKQRDDLYSYSDGMKIDLSRFSSIQDVQIVDDIQMYSAYRNSRARLPMWKFPILSQGKKINKIESVDHVVITWILNDICNYSCRYCPSVLHNGKNHIFDWEQIEPFLDKIFDVYSVKDIKFSLSGGEPTLSPFFPEMVKKIHSQGGTVGITTNLVRTPRFIRDNFKYLTFVACSFHPAQEFVNGTDQAWLDKVKIASMVTSVVVRVMMDPLHWDQTVDFIERLRKETTASVEIVYIEDQYGPSRTKLTTLVYTAEQLEFFKNFESVPHRITEGELLQSNPAYKGPGPGHSIITYSDKTAEYMGSPQELINRGQTNFFDFKCAIGKESLFIHQNGHIKRGNCDVGGWIGTIKDYQNINWDTIVRPVICNSLRCSCGADIPVSKWR